jgi:uncharacterized membrane protein YeaQ/YmgE (transglycosylase-associated protein family)
MIWVLAGGLAGWIACSSFRASAGSGVVSMAAGVLAAFFGGQVVAPLFGGTVLDGGEFSPFALLVAAATAVASLTIRDMMHQQFGS